MCAPPYILPSLQKREITVTSFYDITIGCSTLSAGKLLCMHKGNAIIHLPVSTLKSLVTIATPKPYCLPYPEYCACDTLPKVFRCTLILESEIYLQHSQHLRMDTNTGMYK